MGKKGCTSPIFRKLASHKTKSQRDSIACREVHLCRCALRLENKIQAILDPHIGQSVNKLVLELLRVHWGGSHAEPLAADRDRGVVDALHIDVVLLQKLVRQLLALGRIADLPAMLAISQCHDLEP